MTKAGRRTGTYETVTNFFHTALSAGMRQLKKAVASGVLGVFTVTSVLPPGGSAFAMPGAGGQDALILRENPFGLQVPEHAGDIQGFFKGSVQAPLVVHLSDAHGNKLKAARSLGISRATIYRKIHGYGIVAQSPDTQQKTRLR